MQQRKTTDTTSHDRLQLVPPNDTTHLLLGAVKVSQVSRVGLAKGLGLVPIHQAREEPGRFVELLKASVRAASHNRSRSQQSAAVLSQVDTAHHAPPNQNSHEVGTALHRLSGGCNASGNHPLRRQRGRACIYAMQWPRGKWRYPNDRIVLERTQSMASPTAFKEQGLPSAVLCPHCYLRWHMG